MLMYISSFTAAIHVNYTSEFLGLSEATMYTTHWWKGERELLEKLVKNEQKLFIIKLNRSVLELLNEK